jgi:anti-repressor protein
MDKQSTALTPHVFARDDGEVATTSLNLATVFGKRHDHVLRDIATIMGTAPNPGALGKSSTSVAGWFKPSTYLDGKGEVRPAFDLTRDGFTLLAMGWSGAKAMAFKVQYIEAFNRMATVLQRPPAPAPLSLDDPRALRTLLLGYADKVIELEERVGMLAPKAAALDLLGGKVGSQNITDTAKVLRLSPSYLFTWMSEHQWTFRRRDGGIWRAFQMKIDAGLLEHVELPDKNRPDRSFPQVQVTPNGRAKLAEIFSQGVIAGVGRAA